MRILMLALLLASSMVAVEARAKQIMVPGAVTCKDGMQEQVTISINFNQTADTLTQGKVKFDEKIQLINELAKKQAVEKLQIQSMSYTISTTYNNNSPSYQINGNVNYQLNNADAALKFAEFLSQQKFQVSVSANSYKNGNCSN